MKSVLAAADLEDRRTQRRPILHTEPWAKVTVMMENSHVIYLDLLGLFFRARHDIGVSRAELLRAFVEFMQASGIDFTQFKNADEITAYLLPYFRAIVAERGKLPLLESGLFTPSRQEARTERRAEAPRA